MQYKVMLLITAFIFGTAFVGQRLGMEHIGPFTFSAVRFFIGALSLLPVLYFVTKLRKGQPKLFTGTKKDLFVGGILCGLLMFGGITFQQIGLMYTTAGKAGFITVLYVVLVPVFGVFVRKHIDRNVWFGVMLALIGLYLLSIKADFTFEKGDLIVLGGTFFWAIHILVIDYFASKVDGIKLSFLQFIVTSFLSLCVAWATEMITWSGIEAATAPILYTGIIVVGVAFTLQILGQGGTDPITAAIILSLESVFAVLSGMVVLGEVMTTKEVVGCFIMLSAVILSQLPSKQGRSKKGEKIQQTTS